MKTKLMLAAFFMFSVTLAAVADVSSEFAGFDKVVDERGVSGLQSSYDYHVLSSGLLPSVLPTFGTAKVDYPSVGQFPSPGYYYGDNGAEGHHFDEGILGLKVDANNNLVIKVASGLNPSTGYLDRGWNLLYGQGDMFISLQDSQGVKQFALLNAWATDKNGRTLNSWYDDARTFHEGSEGDLIQLNTEADVLVAGGGGSYSNPPYQITGLDTRVYAKGGTDLGPTILKFSQATGTGIGKVDQPEVIRDWFIQTWTVPISALTKDSKFSIALHNAASCGNDQIGLACNIVVPAPGAIILGMIGLGLTGWARKRFGV